MNKNKYQKTIIAALIASASTFLSGCLESDKEQPAATAPVVGASLGAQTVTKSISKTAGGTLEIQGASVSFAPNSLKVDTKFSTDTATTIRLIEEKTPAFESLLLSDASNLFLPANSADARQLVSDTQITIDLGANSLFPKELNDSRDLGSVVTNAPITVSLTIPQKFKLASNDADLSSEQEGILKIVYRDADFTEAEFIEKNSDFGLKSLNFVDVFVNRTTEKVNFTLPYESIYRREGKYYATFAMVLIKEENAGVFQNNETPAPIQNDDPEKEVIAEELVLNPDEQSQSPLAIQANTPIIRDFTEKTDFGQIYIGKKITVNQLRATEFLSKPTNVSSIVEEIKEKEKEEKALERLDNRLQIQNTTARKCEAHGISSPTGGDKLNYPVSSKYGMRYLELYKSYRHHAGLDLQTPAGVPMYAVCDGAMSQININQSCGGNILYYRCNTGSVMRYLHLQSSLTPAASGNAYRRGQKFNGSVRSGNTGQCTTGAHLHFEYRANQPYAKAGQTIDPQPCIGLTGRTGGTYISDNEGIAGATTNIGNTALISITDLRNGNNSDVLQLFVNNRLICETLGIGGSDLGKTCRTQAISKGKNILQIKAKNLGSDNNRADYRITLGNKLVFTGKNPDTAKGEDATHRVGTILQGQSSLQHLYRFKFN